MSRTQRIEPRKWARIRAMVLSHHPLCAHCLAKGRLTPAVEVDHIVALANGGTHDRANLQSLCSACHIIKTKQDVALLRLNTAVPGVDENGWPIDPQHPWNADPREVKHASKGEVIDDSTLFTSVIAKAKLGVWGSDLPTPSS